MDIVTIGYSMVSKINRQTDRQTDRQFITTLNRPPIDYNYEGFYKYIPGDYLANNLKIPNHIVHINSHGLRGKEFDINKGKNTFRIIGLGGSSTFGEGANEEETYPFYLNEYFSNHTIKNKNIEVINAGVGGFQTSQVKNLLKHFIVKLSPDCLIILVRVPRGKSFV